MNGTEFPYRVTNDRYSIYTDVRIFPCNSSYRDLLTGVGKYIPIASVSQAKILRVDVSAEHIDPEGASRTTESGVHCAVLAASCIC